MLHLNAGFCPDISAKDIDQHPMNLCQTPLWKEKGLTISPL